VRGWSTHIVASDSLAEFVREQRIPLRHVIIQRMFGKIGVFCNGLIFAVVTSNTLYARPA
jgi:DNA transformation protein and related proteins